MHLHSLGIRKLLRDGFSHVRSLGNEVAERESGACDAYICLEKHIFPTSFQKPATMFRLEPRKMFVGCASGLVGAEKEHRCDGEE